MTWLVNLCVAKSARLNQATARLLNADLRLHARMHAHMVDSDGVHSSSALCESQRSVRQPWWNYGAQGVKTDRVTDCHSCIGGKKYQVIDGKKVLIPRLDLVDQNPDKVEAAEIFAASLKVINADKTYLRLKEKHKLEHESKELDLSGIEVVKGVPASRGGEAKGEVGKRALKLERQDKQKKGKQDKSNVK